MKRIYLIFSFLFFTVACKYPPKSVFNNSSSNNTYIIEGKIYGMDSGWLYLEKVDTSRESIFIPLDSAKVADTYFRFKGKLLNPELCKIQIKNLEHGWPYTSYFILDTGLTKGILYNDSMANSIISGTKLQDQFTSFNKKMFELEVSHEKRYLMAKKELKSAGSLNELNQKFDDNKSALILKEVKENPGSFVSAYIANKYISDGFNINRWEDIYNSLENKNNYYSKLLLIQLNARKQTLIGSPSPEFNIIDNKSQTLTNKSFKGKYLLIDFWASWCAPCRKQNPYLIKAYKKYSNKGFDILSISTESTKRNWEIAVKQDKLPWTQVYDKKGPYSQIVQNFGIIVIPTNFLLNKEGKIIAKNLIGERLKNVLQKLFGKN